MTLQNNFQSNEEIVTTKDKVRFLHQSFIEGIVFSKEIVINKYGEEVFFAKIYIERGYNEDKVFIEHVKVSTKNPLIIKDFKEKLEIGTHVKILGTVHNYKNSMTGEKYDSIEPKQVFFGEVIEGMKEEFEAFRNRKTTLHNQAEEKIFNQTNKSNVISY